MNVNFGGMNRDLNIIPVPTISGTGIRRAILLREPAKLRPVKFLKVIEIRERSSFFIQL